MVEGDKFLNVPDVAELLGLHPESVRKMVRQGRLPAFKAGRSWRFDPADIATWRRQQRAAAGAPQILVVDDEPVVCRLLLRLIRRAGYDGRCATDGASGLEMVAQRRPDLVLLDLCMPGMNGAEFLERLRVEHPELPVVIVTGYPDSDLVHQASQHPPVLLLAKPVLADMLQRTLRSVLGDKLTPAAAPARSDG